MRRVEAPTDAGSAHQDFGAFVVSLDFELLWGLRDQCGPNQIESHRRRVLGGRAAIPRILDLFDEYDIAATWAVVGFLFAESRQDLVSFFPSVRPAYSDPGLSPYQEEVGVSEAEDPVHFAPSLIQEIRKRPRQEIATHTFSHYYCLEPGQTREAFEADLRSAVAIADRYGVRLRSIVFPRNQWNSHYAGVLQDAGIRCYRGTPSAWMYQASDFVTSRRSTRRASRLADNYLPLSGQNVTRWEDVPRKDGLYNVPASFYLRPYSPRLRHLEGVRFQRMTQAIRTAAESNGIFHLWWHPWDFGTFTDENLDFLKRMLEAVALCRDRQGLRSLSMEMVMDLVGGTSPSHGKAAGWDDNHGTS